MNRAWVRLTPRPAGARRSDGFILVEVLVTMMISAFLLVVLFSVVSLTVRSFERTSRTGEEMETTSRVLSALKRDIGLVSRVTFSGEDAGFVFTGTRDHLIYAYERVRGELGEMRVANLAVEVVQGGYALRRSEAVFVPSVGHVEELSFGAPEDIYIGPLVVRFAYFDVLADGGEALVDEWTQSTKLPTAIRITFGGAGATAPELLLRIPLLITADPGCAAPEVATCLSIEPAAKVDANDGPQDWWRYVQ